MKITWHSTKVVDNYVKLGPFEFQIPARLARWLGWKIYYEEATDALSTAPEEKFNWEEAYTDHLISFQPLNQDLTDDELYVQPRTRKEFQARWKKVIIDAGARDSTHEDIWVRRLPINALEIVEFDNAENE